jgi:hypothetical protein
MECSPSLTSPVAGFRLRELEDSNAAKQEQQTSPKTTLDPVLDRSLSLANSAVSAFAESSVDGDELKHEQRRPAG